MWNICPQLAECVGIQQCLFSHLLLNEAILGRFQQLLLSAPKREEELHQILVRHPVLLDRRVTESDYLISLAATTDDQRALQGRRDGQFHCTDTMNAENR